MALNTALESVQAPEQLRYARWLEWGAWLGLILLSMLFVSYVSGWLVPSVPIEQLPQVWGLPLTEFLEVTGSPTGWQWLTRLHQPDAASLLGIAVLAGCSVPCLLALVPFALRRGDYLLASLCVVEAAVIMLAGSGLMSAGH